MKILFDHLLLQYFPSKKAKYQRKVFVLVLASNLYTSTGNLEVELETNLNIWC